MADATTIARLCGVAILASLGFSTAQAAPQSIEVKKQTDVLTEVSRHLDVLAQCVNPPTTAPVDKATQQINQRARTAELSSRIA